MSDEFLDGDEAQWLVEELIESRSRIKKRFSDDQDKLLAAFYGTLSYDCASFVSRFGSEQMVQAINAVIDAHNLLLPHFKRLRSGEPDA